MNRSWPPHKRNGQVFLTSFQRRLSGASPMVAISAITQSSACDACHTHSVRVMGLEAIEHLSPTVLGSTLLPRAASSICAMLPKSAVSLPTFLFSILRAKVYSVHRGPEMGTPLSRSSALDTGLPLSSALAIGLPGSSLLTFALRRRPF